MTQLEHHIQLLPNPETAKKVMQSLSVLAFLFEYYSDVPTFYFNAQWDKDEMMGKMDNGCGDEFLFWFHPKGVVLKGFFHEGDTTPYRHKPPVVLPGMYDNFPTELSSFLAEPAFECNCMVTFCAWYLHSNKRWEMGNWRLADWKLDEATLTGLYHPLNDGSDDMMQVYLALTPEDYIIKFEEYYEETEFSTELIQFIRDVYAHQPIEASQIEKLFPEVDLDTLSLELHKIGYPYL